ncbi:uncharacterized protein LOC143041098 isoform X2 [Oratosquilla oratoria]|uniref:uncharacterized protein LOC143041098 isoform X2 n=1 Tax=Oratosquilla oratoria TaxID=337810 RepID=UPI003F77039F
MHQCFRNGFLSKQMENQRIPIGWNYQLKTSKDVGQTVKFNGKNKERRDSDEIEVIDIKEVPSNRKPMLYHPPSRQEIRATVRNTTQSSLRNYFTPVVKKDVKPKKEEEDRKSEKEKGRRPNEKDQANLCQSEDSARAMDRFIERWFEVKVGKDDGKIKDKLWKNYYLAHTSFTHSQKFILMCDSFARRLSIDNVYVMIKDLIDSLKHYKDRPYKEIDDWTKEVKEDSIENPEESEENLSEEEKKRLKKLRKIEKKMKQICDKIKECEELEVDLDDEDNSVYLVEDRLKRQFSRLHDYYCKLAQCSPATGRPVERKFRYDGSRYGEINKRITAWVNKHKIFPDYSDVLNLVKRVTRDSSLPLRPETVRVQAQEIFRDVGKMLKERRQSDDLYSIYAYVPPSKEGEVDKDPAANDTDLNQQLLENEKTAREKTEKIFELFVNKEAEERAAIDQAKKDTKASKKSQDDDAGTQDGASTSTGGEGEGKSGNGPESEGKVEGEEVDEDDENNDEEDENNDDDEEEEEEEEMEEEDTGITAEKEEEGQPNDASSLQEELSDDEDIEKVLQIPAEEEEDEDEEEEEEDDDEDDEEDVPIVDVNGFDSHDTDTNKADQSEGRGNSSPDMFGDEKSPKKRSLDDADLPVAKRISIPLLMEDEPKDE